MPFAETRRQPRFRQTARAIIALVLQLFSIALTLRLALLYFPLHFPSISSVALAVGGAVFFWVRGVSNHRHNLRFLTGGLTA